MHSENPVTRRPPEADEGCPGAVGNAALPQGGSVIVKCSSWKRMGFPRFGDSDMEGVPRKGESKGGTQGGEERHGDLLQMCRI
jgi:hypothetical protein